MCLTFESRVAGVFFAPTGVKCGEQVTIPLAIIATNSITPAAQARFTDAGHADALNCLIMPTQWGETASTDPNVGWDYGTAGPSRGGSLVIGFTF